MNRESQFEIDETGETGEIQIRMRISIVSLCPMIHLCAEKGLKRSPKLYQRTVSHYHSLGGHQSDQREVH